MKYFLLQQYLGHHWKSQVVLPLVPQRFVSPLLAEVVDHHLHDFQVQFLWLYTLQSPPCIQLNGIPQFFVHISLYFFYFINKGPTFPCWSNFSWYHQKYVTFFIFIKLNPSTSLSVVSNLNAHVKTILSSKFM